MSVLLIVLTPDFNIWNVSYYWLGHSVALLLPVSEVLLEPGSVSRVQEFRGAVERANQKLSLVANSYYVSALFSHCFARNVWGFLPHQDLVDSFQDFPWSGFLIRQDLYFLNYRIRGRRQVTKQTYFQLRRRSQCGQIILRGLQFSSIKFFTVIFVPDFINSW